MRYDQNLPRQKRIMAMMATIFITLAVGAILILGMRISPWQRLSEAMKVMNIPLPSPPPETPVPPEPPADKASAEAAPPNKEAKPKPIEAPKPILPPLEPPKIIAALKAGVEDDIAAGASTKQGSGTGSGGKGSGFGAGGSGNGAGGGTRPTWRSGTIRDSDYPRSAAKNRRAGEVEMRFTIETNGRVSGCRISKSSGDPALDETSCRLIEERFRFRPATDGSGKAIASPYGWRQSWWLESRR